MWLGQVCGWVYLEEEFRTFDIYLSSRISRIDGVFGNFIFLVDLSHWLLGGNVVQLGEVCKNSEIYFYVVHSISFQTFFVQAFKTEISS